MLLKTPADIGALIRDARRKAKLSQIDLAAQIDTTQGWVSEVENGKATAEIGMVLKALNALGLRLDSHSLTPSGHPDAVDVAHRANAGRSRLADVLSRTRGGQ